MNPTHTVGGAVLGPSRLPPARPNTCQSQNCDDRPVYQLAHPRETRIVWVCPRCTPYWQQRGWELADGIGGVKR